MDNSYKSVMEQHTNAELIKIIKEERHNYLPEAIFAAETELAKRNLNDEQFSEAIRENMIERQIAEAKHNEELNLGIKILTFIFPGIIQIAFAGTYKADGYHKKARELVRWTLYGFVFYIIFLLLLKMIF